MSTTQDLINETLSYLLAGTREQMVRLNGDHDDVTTDITFLDEIQFRAPTVLSIGLEDMMVWETNHENRTAVVERGWAGSTAGFHFDQTAVTINAKFAPSSVLRALNSELAALSSPKNGLFQVAETVFTYNPAHRGYNLDTVTDVGQILDIRYNAVGPERDWPRIKKYDLVRDGDLTAFPSGVGLVIDGAEPGRAVRVTFKAPFGQLNVLDDVVSEVAGLSEYADDIPPLGAAARLMTVREGARNFFEHQPGTRRAEEVPPGSQLRGAQGLMQFRAIRIGEESTRLSRQYPVRIR